MLCWPSLLRIRVEVALTGCIRGILLRFRVAVVVNGDHLNLIVGGEFEIRLTGLHKVWSPGERSAFFPQKANGDEGWNCTMFVFRPLRIPDQMGGDLSKCLGSIFIIGVEFQSNFFSNTDDTTSYGGKKCG